LSEFVLNRSLWAQQEPGRLDAHNAELARLNQAVSAGDPTAQGVLVYILADAARLTRLSWEGRTGDQTAQRELDGIRAHHTALMGIHREAAAGDQTAQDVLDHILTDNAELKSLSQVRRTGNPTAQRELNITRAHHTALMDIYREVAAGDPTARRQLNSILGLQPVEYGATLGEVIAERHAWLNSQSEKMPQSASFEVHRARIAHAALHRNDTVAAPARPSLHR
jgi:hypothetical protein